MPSEFLDVISQCCLCLIEAVTLEQLELETFFLGKLIIVKISVKFEYHVHGGQGKTRLKKTTTTTIPYLICLYILKRVRSSQGQGYSILRSYQSNSKSFPLSILMFL